MPGPLTLSTIFANDPATGRPYQAATGHVDEHGRKQNEWEEFYPGGALMARGVYQDNLEQGEWQVFHEKGALCIDEAAGDGGVLMATSSGGIKYLIQYDQGKKHGRMKYFADSFEQMPCAQTLPALECAYTQGVIDGFYRSRTKGMAGEAGTYHQGVRVGRWQVMDGRGNALIGEYNDGQRSGEWCDVAGNVCARYHNDRLLSQAAYDSLLRRRKWQENTQMLKSGAQRVADIARQLTDKILPARSTVQTYKDKLLSLLHIN